MSLTHSRGQASALLSKANKSLLYDSAVVLAGHEGPVYTAQFSPQGQTIASGGHDKSILLWHLPTVANEAKPNYGILTGHKSAVTSLTWLLESSIFSTSADSTIAFWDAETGERFRKGVGHEGVVNECSGINNGVCVSVGDDGTIRVWDEREKHEVSKIDTKYPLLTCNASKDGHTVFVSGIDPTVQAFDLRTNEAAWKCSGMQDSVTSLGLNSDGSMLSARAMDGSIRTLSAKAAVPPGIPRMSKQVYAGATGSLQQVLARISFTNDDVYIGLGSDDATAIMWGTASGRMVNKFSGNEGTVIDVDFHPSEKILLSSGSKGEVIVRDY
ncbi:CIC11C00000003124 [Sungouiella intermedia]|uniref:CIC11C00000003124 n=1 Tax=Sungouiella intermedia TaxID=45354 RepID=A0A1L0DMV9_9ASCO|nr:CIC11C00000003124 [[Candida] intermedia]